MDPHNHRLSPRSTIKKGYAGIKKSQLGNASISNPVGKFPRRKDTVHTLWAARDAKAALELYEETHGEYLLEFKKRHLDGNNSLVLPDASFAQSGDFGIVGHDDKSRMKRVYRELQANRIFRVEEVEEDKKDTTRIGLTGKKKRKNYYKRPRSPTEQEVRRSSLKQWYRGALAFCCKCLFVLTPNRTPPPPPPTHTRANGSALQRSTCSCDATS